MVASTVRVLLNEIYWMANDVQLKAAMGAYSHIATLMKRAWIQKRKYVVHSSTAHQHQHQQPATTKTATSTPPAQQQQPPTASNKTTSATNAAPRLAPLTAQQQQQQAQQVWRAHDIKETSLHVHISSLNVHLYTDDNPCGNELLDGAAMQCLFHGLCLDHYPYHVASMGVQHWHNYTHTYRERAEWSRSLMASFVDKLAHLLLAKTARSTSSSSSSSAAASNSLAKWRRHLVNLSMLEACTVLTLKDLKVYKVTTNMSHKPAASAKHRTRSGANQQQHQETQQQQQQQPPLHHEFLRSKQFFIDQQQYDTRHLIESNSAAFNLPPDTQCVQLFFADYYFANECAYPVPSAQVYAHISPLHVNVDLLTVLWLHALALSFTKEAVAVVRSHVKASAQTDAELAMHQQQQQQQQQQKQQSDEEAEQRNAELQHVDTHVELVMPKIGLAIYANGCGGRPSTERQDGVGDGEGNSAGGKCWPLMRPRATRLEIGFSRISLANTNQHTNNNSNSSSGSSSGSKTSQVMQRAHASSRFLRTKQAHMEHVLASNATLSK